MPIYPSSNSAADDVTIQYNSSNELSVKPTTITQSDTLSDITYSSNTTLTGNIYANNVTINSGVTITTNGYNFFCSGTFTNNGTINANTTNGGSGGAAGSTPSTGGAITTSYGGSGGGGGYDTANGAAGGATIVAGGTGGSSSTVGGSAGSTPSAPTLTNALISSWYVNGFNNYLSGAGGGGGQGSTPGAGGNGSTGIYIQASTIIAGTINTTGNGGVGGNSGGGGGGGGGGAILLAYGSGGYTAGTYNTGGGSGGGDNLGTVGGNGGSGGAGLIMTYSGQPILLTNFSYTTAVNSITNRNSSYQYAPLSSSSTSNTIAISQSIKPQTSGLIRIRASAIVSNNTIGSGVSMSLYNGTTLLDTDSYTQEGLANNHHLITLYTEQLFTSPFSQQTYSIQYAAITNGDATCEIQEFTIEEAY